MFHYSRELGFHGVQYTHLRALQTIWYVLMHQIYDLARLKLFVLHMLTSSSSVSPPMVSFSPLFTLLLSNEWTWFNSRIYRFLPEAIHWLFVVLYCDVTTTRARDKQTLVQHMQQEPRPLDLAAGNGR